METGTRFGPVSAARKRQGGKDMAERGKRKSKREDIIRAGIDEINRYGIANISMRRIADASGVSCGAPYKHFGNRKAFIAAVIEYVNQQWYEVQKEILASNEGDTRKQIVELSVGYVQFLADKPHFRAVLLLKDDEFDNTYHKMRGEISSPTQQLIGKYCLERNIDDEARLRKVYIIRALIFGAAHMFDTGEMEYSPKALQILRDGIDRELDLA
jgi:AcrR family transcriptional regulator